MTVKKESYSPSYFSKPKCKGMKTKSPELSYDDMLIVVWSSVRYLFYAPNWAVWASLLKPCKELNLRKEKKKMISFECCLAPNPHIKFRQHWPPQGPGSSAAVLTVASGGIWPPWGTLDMWIQAGSVT